MELANTKSPQIFFEAKLYHHLNNDSVYNNNIDRGIPKMHYFGAEGEYNLLVMDLLGPSLEDLFT